MYFNTLDSNGNGIIEEAEFVPLFRFILLDVYPLRALQSMNISTPQIIAYVLYVITLLALIFSLVMLVMQAFSVSGPAGGAVHSTVNTGAAAAMKMFSDNGIGFEGSM